MARLLKGAEHGISLVVQASASQSKAHKLGGCRAIRNFADIAEINSFQTPLKRPRSSAYWLRRHAVYCRLNATIFPLLVLQPTPYAFDQIINFKGLSQQGYCSGRSRSAFQVFFGVRRNQNDRNC